MRTEYLREFVVFSRHLSFTEAAKELFIAQSTLSTHIAALESDVGFSLIDRKAGNRLTDKGAVFLDGARTLLDGLDETLARCREMGDPDATLRIAVQYPTPSFAAQAQRAPIRALCFRRARLPGSHLPAHRQWHGRHRARLRLHAFRLARKGSERPRPGNENMLGLPHEYQHDGVEPFGKQARSFAQRP